MSNNVAIDMDRLKETFFIESEEHISNMESCILEMEKDSKDPEILNAIFRAAHSMKGNSGCLGFKDINSFTHILETVLDRLRNGEMESDERLISLLLKSVDCVKTLVEAAREGKDVATEVSGTLGSLKSLLNGEGENSSAAKEVAKADRRTRTKESMFKIAFAPGQDVLKRGIDPLNHILKQLPGRVIATFTDTSGLPCLSDLDPETCYLKWELFVFTDEPRSAVEDVFEFVREESHVVVTELAGNADEGQRSPVQVAPSHEEHPVMDAAEHKMIGEILIDEKVITTNQLAEALKKQKAAVAHREEQSSTIRVDTTKIDKLVNLVGEFVITQSMIARLATSNSAEKSSMLQNAALQLERNTREIQERVMSIRMLPVGTVFGKFARLVRDLSQANGKKVSLAASGEDTELDKTVIEKISDPLTHLIRNAVDHGIETPEEREGNGKCEIGTIRLSACHSGGYVVVAIEDDGRGLDREKIIKKAVEKGLVEEYAAENMTDTQVFDLIYQPGFSTAEKVTDVSGRGVGMDVVKKNIEGLGGSVAVESRKGEGTKVSLRIPLTLAIIDGLTVKVGDDTFILPITAILESLRPKPEEVKMVQGEGEAVSIRGSYIPLVRLHGVFGIKPSVSDPWNSIVVVIQASSGRYALMVDELTGEQQVVIKSIGDGLRNIPGIAGATILGDGRVSLILDIEGLVKKYLTE